jgi:hypothetical protein
VVAHRGGPASAASAGPGGGMMHRCTMRRATLSSRETAT